MRLSHRFVFNGAIRNWVVLLPAFLLITGPLSVAAEAQNFDPESLKALIQSLETLKADPESLPIIETWMDQAEEELAEKQQSAAMELEQLQKQLAEAESERENLRSRLDALNVALILLDEHPSGESVTALAKTEETAPPQTLADGQGNEIPIITRTVEFETEIYPIFQQRCFECHGPDKHRGQLRLDAREVVLKKGDNA
ncbi:MAG: hypothetical protein KC994_22570, partial [Candidatus Omnitrophica bacterium]|nr:hypothetical protein [Candidatus Omnitrophota bacterium]